MGGDFLSTIAFIKPEIYPKPYAECMIISADDMNTASFKFLPMYIILRKNTPIAYAIKNKVISFILLYIKLIDKVETATKSKNAGTSCLRDVIVPCFLFR